MATDWTAVKLSYVNSNKTLREVATDHGIKAAGVMARASKEGWEAERKQKQAEVSKIVQDELIEDRASKLAKFNEQDARIAEALKAKAEMLLEHGDLDDKKLANLTRVFDGAQKIGLLALGAATENVNSTVTSLPASVDDFV